MARCNVRWHHNKNLPNPCEPLTAPAPAHAESEGTQRWQQLGWDIKAHRDAELNGKSAEARRARS